MTEYSIVELYKQALLPDATSMASKANRSACSLADRLFILRLDCTFQTSKRSTHSVLLG